MAIKAKQYKKIVDLQQDRDIYAKDDMKNEVNPMLSEPEPDMDKEPAKWQAWKLAQDRMPGIKARQIKIDASNKRGTES
jgi:hypothetical protein